MHIDPGVGPEERREPHSPSPSASIPFEELERIREALKARLVEHGTKRWVEFLDRPENIRGLEVTLNKAIQPFLHSLKQFYAEPIPEYDMPEELKQAKKIIPKIVEYAPLCVEMLVYSPTIRGKLAAHLAKQEFSDSFALSADFAGHKTKLRGLGVPEPVIEQFGKIEQKLEAVNNRRSQLLDYRVQISRELGIDMAASESTRVSFLRMMYPTKEAYLSQLDSDARESAYAIRDTLRAFSEHRDRGAELNLEAVGALLSAVSIGIGPEGPIRGFLRKFDIEDAERVFADRPI